MEKEAEFRKMKKIVRFLYFEGCLHHTYRKTPPGGGQKGRPNIYMERYREFGAVFRTFSLSLADEQIFPPRKTQNIPFRAVLLYIIPFQRTFGGVKLFKLRIDFQNLIV